MADDRDDAFVKLTFSTWVYQLFAAGVMPDDATLHERCSAVQGAADRTAGDAAGASLVDRVGEILGGGSEPETVTAAARKLYGDRASTGLGDGDREERTQRIRKYQFGRSLPWLARIWERRDGAVRPSWLLVERVTDQVTAMDPNPWNDIDEERRIPVADFQVLWELDGCTNVHV
jgi:hypothetical protein